MLLALDAGRIGERYILGGDNLMLADMLASSPSWPAAAAANPAADRRAAAGGGRGRGAGAADRA